MKNTNREIWVGKNKLYLGEDNVLYVSLVGDINEKAVQTLEKASFEIRSGVKEQVNVLVDLNKIGKPTPKARKKGQDILKKEGFGKIAFFGIHPVAQVIASFFMGATQKKDILSFKNKEKALKWINE